MNCCQETGSMRSTERRYQDLETVLSNMHQQQQYQLPSLEISLDLPVYAEYLPTYWPGQKITGDIRIQLQNNSPIKVTHLRIALYGNVQVYGDHPGHPMTNGLFDYQKNEQLLSTGLRIVRRSSSPSEGREEQDLTYMPSDTRYDNTALTGITSPISTQDQERNDTGNDDNMEQQQDERRWKLYCRRDERENTQGNSTEQSSRRPKPKKTPEDRHIEKLIRQAAAIDSNSNVCSGNLDDATFHSDLHVEAFELDTNSCATNTVAFSIRVPTSRKLAGTFDHSHCPISYKVVAIMKCRDKSDHEVICYSTIRVRLESILDINAPEYESAIISNPTRHYVHNNSLLSGVCTYVLSSSSVLTYWLHKLTQNRQNRQIASSSSDYLSSYLESSLELPRRAFERSQRIPLKLNFVNHAAQHFKISAIKIYIELVRRINMTCSMNEEIEENVIQSVPVLFKSIEEEEEEAGRDEIVFFRHANMCFDLSSLLQIPEDVTCTIASILTKDIFSLNYQLTARVDVTGLINTQETPKFTHLQSQTNQNQTSVCYYASNKHIIKEDPNDSILLPKEPYYHKFKTYTLLLDSLSVVVGNSTGIPAD